MRADLLRHLRCPLEGGVLTAVDGGVRCRQGHRFDTARQGYLNLLTGRPHATTGDTAAMVAAREAVFEAGHLGPLSDAVATVVEDALPLGAEDPGAIVDVGAGTGHHLARVLDRARGRVGVALDLSVYAARRAARRHPRLAAVVCDVWQPLPVRTATADVVLSVFAPRAGAEVARILRPDGLALAVTPTSRHLHELVEPLGLLTIDPRKDERLAAALGPTLIEAGRSHHDHRLVLGHDAVRTMVAMGPSAHHLTSEILAERLAALPDRLEVTVSVTLHRYRPR